MDFAAASPKETQQYVRRYFARADLPEVDGFDPFLTAAAVLSGDARGSPLELMPSFSQMHHDSLLQAVQAPVAVRHASAQPALEVARRRHQVIVRELSQTLVDHGLQPHYNARVDVAVLASGCDVLFEVKTATPGNFLQQLRAAVGQLLEYRFRLRRSTEKTVRLVVAIEGSSEAAELEFARQFLASIDLDLVLWREHHRFEGLTPLLRRIPVCAEAG